MIKDRGYVDCALGITVGTIFLVLSFILRCLNIAIIINTIKIIIIIIIILIITILP